MTAPTDVKINDPDDYKNYYHTDHVTRNVYLDGKGKPISKPIALAKQVVNPVSPLELWNSVQSRNGHHVKPPSIVDVNTANSTQIHLSMVLVTTQPTRPIVKFKNSSNNKASSPQLDENQVSLTVQMMNDVITDELISPKTKQNIFSTTWAQTSQYLSPLRLFKRHNDVSIFDQHKNFPNSNDSQYSSNKNTMSQLN